jgi:GWxTD domain-containing protein
MRKAALALLILGLGTSLPVQGLSQKTPLSARHKAWLEEDVAYIITPVERDVFKKLETEADRDALIEEFWRQRDPTPGTDRNELKEEHDRRLAFADKTFGRGSPIQGRRTERGRIYITLGPPIDVQRFLSGEAVPMELWTVAGRSGLGQPSTLRILFFQRGGGGDYVIYNPIADSPKDLVQTPRQSKLESWAPADWDEWDMGAYWLLRDRMLKDVMDMTFAGERGVARQREAILLAEVQATPQRMVKTDYALAILEHKPAVEVSYSVNLIGNRSAVAVLEEPGGGPYLHIVMVPERVSIDRYNDRYLADLRTTLRLSDPAGRTVLQREKSTALDLRPEELKRLQAESFQLYDAVPVLPGKWKMSLLLENMMTGEFTVVDKEIEVPGPGAPGLSPLILARQVFREAPEGGAMSSFRVGWIQVYPSVNNVFPERSKFHAFLQLRGLAEDLRAKGRMRFVLIGDGAPLWSVERALGDYPEPRAVLEEVDAGRLAAGTYTLRASVLDADGREIMFSQTELRLTSNPVPGLWVAAIPLPAAGDPEIDFLLGTQALALGRTEAAVAALARASAAGPKVLRYAVAYAQALMVAGQAAGAREALLLQAEGGKTGFELFETLGRACRESGRPGEAVAWLTKALLLRGNIVEVLNLLGECHAELGDQEAAAAAWRKSLEISPDQPRIRGKLGIRPPR